MERILHNGAQVGFGVDTEQLVSGGTMNTIDTMDLVRVLLVEGNPIFLHIAMLLLQKHYHNQVAVVGVAGESEDALTQARNLQPNVILLDLGIPGLRSLDIIPRLRTILPRARIIALGLLDTNSLRQSALAAGADDFIPKAMLNSHLMPAIERTV
jgi:DNA-binding NarL/FixJ family response regulator